MADRVAKVIDLDAVIPGTFEIRMKGKSYDLPRSVPLVTAVEIMKVFQGIQTNTDEQGNARVQTGIMEELFELIAKLFQDKYPDVTIDWLKMNLTFQQATILTREVVGEIFHMESEQGNP